MVQEDEGFSSLIPKAKTKLVGKKRVNFGSVKIYHFEVALGNCPSVSSGPPICLGALVKQSVTTVNYLEMESVADEWFATEQTKTRTAKLSSDERVTMLLMAGVSCKAIEEATIEAWEARNELMEAMQRRRAKKERSENFRRFFTKLFLRHDEALIVADVKEATTKINREADIKVKKPIVRAAMAC